MAEISSIYNNSNISQVTNNGTPIVYGNQTADTNMFLKLLVAQMTNQDPFSSNQDPTQYVTQLAQFSQLEQMQQFNSNLNALSAINNGILINSALSTATTMIGKEADFYEINTSTGAVETITGTVKSVFVENGSVYFEISMNDTDEIKAVRYDAFLKVRNKKENN